MTNTTTTQKYGPYDEFQGETLDGWPFEVCAWADVATVIVPNMFSIFRDHVSPRMSAVAAFELLAAAGGMSRRELLDRIYGE